MRANMPPQSPLVFPLKHGTGGIVDIEFLVQFGVLSGAHDHPALTAWTDIIRLLDALAEVGFLSPDDAGFLKHAYCTLRERVHRAALQEIAAEVPITEYHDLRTRVSQIGQHLMGCDTSPFLSS
jgi:glutamate-ammonia-ligase adenylyltransferase